jgi:hypothetical protein
VIAAAQTGKHNTTIPAGSPLVDLKLPGTATAVAADGKTAVPATAPTPRETYGHSCMYVSIHDHCLLDDRARDMRCKSDRFCLSDALFVVLIHGVQSSRRHLRVSVSHLLKSVYRD